MEGQRDLYCDGSSTNHAGPRSIARWTVTFESGEKLADVTGWGTNNEAEYKALIDALHIVMLSPRPEHVVIHLDSELVFMQVMDKYRVRNYRLRKLYDVAKKLMDATVTRVLSLKLELETGGKNPAHVTVAVDTLPDVYNGISNVIELLPKYEEMLRIYNEREEFMTALWTEENSEPDTYRRPFVNEIRQEARQWLNEKGKRCIGILGVIPSKTLVRHLYGAGAESVDVVDPAVGGTGVRPCNTIRVKLPFTPSYAGSEDLMCEGTIPADKALDCIQIMTELDTAKVQQASDDQTVFYVIW